MKAEIDVNGDLANGHVVVDGQELYVTGFKLEAEVGHVPTLTADLPLVRGASINAEARVIIPKETHDALVALGWTPPVGDA